MNIICAQPGFTAEEIAAIEAVLPQFPVRDRALVKFALTTGLRISSILAVTCGRAWAIGDVRKAVVIPRGDQKNGRSVFHQRSVQSQVVPLCEELRGLIRQVLFERYGSGSPVSAEALFISREGHRLSRRQATFRLKQIMMAAGLRDRVGYGWHSCRRWFARTAYSEEVTGHDIHATSRLLFHTSIVPTERYLRLDEVTLGNAYAGIAAQLAGVGREISPLKMQSRANLR